MPPNEPATPGKDRLFGPSPDICSLCGIQHNDASFVFRDSGNEGIEGHSCCHKCSGEYKGDASGEIRRRKSAPTPAFKPGDEVAGIGHPTSNRPGKLVIGRIRSFPSEPGEFDGCAFVEHGEQFTCCTAVTLESLKPAPAPVEFFGTMPDELPAVVGDGSRTKRLGLNASGYRLAVVDGGQRYVHPQWPTSDSCHLPSQLDWATVPKPSQKPVTAPQKTPAANASDGEEADYRRVAPSGGDSVQFTQPPEPGQSPPDRYAVHNESVLSDGDKYITDNRNAERRDARIAALSASDDPLDRLAARRQRIASARQATEREAGVKHPSDWDVDDAEELTVS